MQKLYCFVDETGQDIGSEDFIVVTVVSDKDQEKTRDALLEIENVAKVGIRKWHKSKPERRMRYLQLVLSRGIGSGEVYVSRYRKPVSYFMAIAETIEKAIKDKAEENYQALVYIDGIDKKKARELTTLLRLRGIQLASIKGRRDDSEPFIRLADRWAGCIRRAHLHHKSEQEIITQAKERHYLKELP